MSEQATVDAALEIIQRRMAGSGLPIVDNVEDAKNLAKLRLGGKEQEEFLVLFLDGQFRYIKDEIMFRGSDCEATVSPKVIARRAIELNASAVLVAHNHPSGVNNASEQDIALTKRLAQALALIDAILVDHLIVGDRVVSMGEMELL